MHEINASMTLSLFLWLPLISVVASGQVSTDPSNPTRYYGNKYVTPEDSIIIIDLKEYYDFQTFYSILEEKVCNQVKPVVNLSTPAGRKSIFLQNICWKKYGCILIRHRNVLQIENDSIYKGNKSYSLDSLKYILVNDFTNPNKDPRFCQSPKKFLISLTFDNECMYMIPEVLDRITDIYDELEIEANLNICFQNRRIFPPPPPPPPHQRID